ncbi:hypothetical protein OJ997_10420 [Solirubrobacter phytolaccae]|uniref:Uncharacterized protein n=1 Tax=Solirubrobacter phytolaccae TaxID=1404360 RepID=A0A9X3SET0_9ACTN|nr:hypothetical protein [Solirubrobacter phytolaccae]MDA0180707.1 hypothetical protein [Solirubrobacter phytolaccae]
MLAIEESEAVQRPEPRPGVGEVLVRNRFIGTPGGEAAGEVVAAADPALIGQAVVYFPGGGRYAEYAAVPVEELVPLEPGTPLDVAAALAFDGTAAYVLTHVGFRLRAGDRVAATGLVAQLAELAGAELVTENAKIAYGGGLEQLASRGTLILHGGNPHGRIDVERLAERQLSVHWVDTAHYLATPAARAMALRFVLERVEPEILERVPLRDAARGRETPESGKVLLIV